MKRRITLWWAETYDHHVVSRLIRRCGYGSWWAESATNLGAWFDLLAERYE